jgi:protein O-GlcNAc transferase
MPTADPQVLLGAGRDAHKKGDLASARRIYQQVLRLWPEHPHALHLLGVLEDAEGRHAEAVRLIGKALPALDAKPHVHNNLANALRHAGDPKAARRHYEKALALKPGYVQALHNLGVLLAAPGPAEDLAAARDCLRRAVALQPGLFEAWLELARLARREGKLPAAIESYRKVLELRPDELAALIDLGALYQVTLDLPKALPLLERAAELAPAGSPLQALAFFNLAQALGEAGRNDRSEACHRQVLELDPGAIHSRLAVAKAERDRCRWDGWEETRERMASLGAAQVAQAPAPFLLNLYPVPPAVHRAVAREYSRRFEQRAAELGGPLPPRPAAAKKRLRLGYLSADFRHHPVGHLCHGIFAALDRERFEAFAYSLLPADDEVTAAVRSGCELYRDCARWSDQAVARQIRDDGIDILVDLTGYTTYSRPAILALRPAPLQLQHLGYVNTMGAAFIDYQIVDGTVVGPEQRPFYDEKVISLPGCVFPVSPLGALGKSAARPSRESEGLPADATVFCSFNGPSKLDPPTFDAWMEILHRVPGSALWLYDGDDVSLPENLRCEAERRGVAARRLHFAGKAPYPDHLARYPLADLFLDSFTYNGGATAVDALRQGLPMLTRIGETPLSRMGASVARAAGLPDLVAENSEKYVEVAIELGNDREALAGLHGRSGTLFDLRGWLRGYQAGLSQAWEYKLAGHLEDVEVPVD